MATKKLIDFMQNSVETTTPNVISGPLTSRTINSQLSRASRLDHQIPVQHLKPKVKDWSP